MYSLGWYEPGKTVSLDPNISIVVTEDRDGLYAIDCLDPDMVDLVGGYYDAGDNVKFGFPMAFTTTMLS
ncbi:hypothetical protein LXL04_028687 [Taraxacum kok-saghyz]